MAPELSFGRNLEIGRLDIVVAGSRARGIPPTDESYTNRRTVKSAECGSREKYMYVGAPGRRYAWCERD